MENKTLAELEKWAVEGFAKLMNTFRESGVFDLAVAFEREKRREKARERTQRYLDTRKTKRPYR